MAKFRPWTIFASVSLAIPTLAGAAAAQQPKNWQMGFQPPASPSAVAIVEFHDTLLVIITLITLFVLALLLFVMFRFSEKRNPTPS